MNKNIAVFTIFILMLNTFNRINSYGQGIIRSSTLKKYATEPKTKVTKGLEAPDFEFISDNGESKRLSEFKGKVVLINFFSTNCGPCRAELPNIQKEIVERYKNNTNFELIVIGVGNPKSELSKYKKMNQISLTIYPDKRKKIYEKYANSGIPQSYIIDKNGIIVFISEGYYKIGFDEMLKVLNELLQ